MPILEDKLTRVSIHIKFEAPLGENPSLGDLNSFLEAISKLHEFAILNTQLEYYNSISGSNLILEHHKLQIETFCRKNPFDLTLTFHLIQEGIIAYWPFIKAFVHFCKKYGKNTGDLVISLNQVRMYFEEYYNNLLRPNNIDIYPNAQRAIRDKDIWFDRLNNRFLKLFSNNVFIKYYNRFCNTVITITDFVSTIEKINNIDECNFLKD